MLFPLLFFPLFKVIMRFFFSFSRFWIEFSSTIHRDRILYKLLWVINFLSPTFSSSCEINKRICTSLRKGWFSFLRLLSGKKRVYCRKRWLSILRLCWGKMRLTVLWLMGWEWKKDRKKIITFLSRSHILILVNHSSTSNFISCMK